jgi:serine/threonine-protein kinase
MTDEQPRNSATTGGANGQDLSVGSRIAGYVVGQRLGAGGMAVVYRAADQRLGRQVALKILAPHFAADDAFRQRFIRESRTAAAVDDPHIIPVFEAGEADGVLFIAMRYVPGGDVHSLVRATGPLPRERAALILSQVASALDAAHRRGLVHRDVKPANMLMDVSHDRPDHIYLSDFGLSKLAVSGSAITGTGMVLGTLDYVAPEQIDGQPVSGQADQYALACSAFELLSGAPPFARDQPMQLIWSHMSEQPPSLTARRPELPAPVDDVVRRALAKLPAERFATCREFTNALREAIGLTPYDSGGRAVPTVHQPPAAAPALQPRVPIAEPQTPAPALQQHLVATDHGDRAIRDRGPRRWPALFVGISVLAAAGIVGGTLLLTSQGAGSAGRNPGATGTATQGRKSTRAGQSAKHSPGSAGPHSPASSANSYAFLHTLTPNGSSQGVNALAFSSLGSLATAGDSGIVHVWNPMTGHPQLSIPTTSLSPVRAVAFSPDGRILAAGDDSGHIYLWNAATAALLRTLPDAGLAQIQSAAFNPAGTILATGDSAGVTYLWDAATGKQIGALPDPRSKGVDTLAWSPDGKTLAAGDYNGMTYLWQVSTRTKIRAFPAPNRSDILSVSFNPTGTVLATGAYNGSTYLWNVATGGQIAMLTDPGAQHGVEAVAFAPDGRTLAAGDVNGNTYLWNLRTDRHFRALPSAGTVWAVGFSKNGTLLAIGDHKAGTFVWRAG